MTEPVSDPNDRDTPSSSSHPVRDRRRLPIGVLPRRLQTWLMVAVAGVILLIILITGHPQPPAKPEPLDRAPSAALAPADRIRGFQQQLSDDEIRLRQLAARGNSAPPPAVAASSSEGSSSRVADDPRRRSEASLSADNVAFTRRSGSSSTATNAGQAGGSTLDGVGSVPGSELAALDPLLRALTAGMPSQPGALAPVVPSPVAPASPSSTPSTKPVADDRGSPVANRLRILEGTVIEAVLLNRLDGTYSGPVTALVTSPVYSQDRQHLIIPAGARVLGAAAAVQSWGDTRLAVSFHRLVMPDGQTYSLDLFKGLSQVGDTGLRDRVDRHYWQVFGASLAVGALSGLAQLQTRTGLDMNFADAAGQGAGSSLATSATRILDRYLNVLPTVTIREGYRLKVYLTSDLDLPAYGSASGGVR